MSKNSTQNDPIVNLIAFGLVVLFVGWLWLSNKASSEEWGKEAEPPKLTYEVGSSSTNRELLRISEEDGVLVAYLPDMNDWKNFNPDTKTWTRGYFESDMTPAISFWVTNENAKLKKADYTLEFWTGDHQSSEKPDFWSDKLTLSFNDPWQYGTLEGEVVARNTAGETRKKVRVTKMHMDEACDKFDPEYKTATCQGRLKREAQVAEEKRREQAYQERLDKMPVNSGPSCLHKEAGRCWDDVDEAGYEDGMYDGMRGTYSLSYFDTLPEEFGDCTGLCEDIYEDAYNEGYVDGQQELKRRR